MGRTHLHFFGGVSLEVHDRTIRNFGTTRAAKLLVLLSLARSGRMPRTQLADQLWPDDFYDSTRLRLRQEIHRLKRVLEEFSDLIGSDQNDVWIDKTQVVSDVDILQNVIKGREEPGVDCCFTGEFLPGWDDTWAIAERTHVNQLQVQAGISLGTQKLELGDADGALAVARKLVAQHPLHEELRMVAVNAHAKLGSVAAAVAEYQDLRKQMREQLGVEPSSLNNDLIAGLAATAHSSTPKQISVVKPPADWSSTVPYVLDEVLGREAVLTDVLTRLNHPANRIVTLVGPGGVGKTCLASEAARQMVQANKSRVAFASLADVADPEQWPRAVLSQLREDPPAESVPIRFLSSLLKESPTTLILDNVETVLPVATEGIRELVSLTPGLQLLITSVTPTKAAGEQLVPLGPLDPATAGRDLLVAALQVTRPQTLSQPGALDELLEISKRLDGYPLALRLAAARLRLLSPKALLDQLESSLATSARGDLPERHRSLETALATSVSTLSAEQKDILGKISAYPGGLSMDLAGIQFAGQPYLDHIEALLDSALLRLEEQSDPVRVRLLSPVRKYVWTQLTEEQRTANERNATESIWKFLETFDIAPWRPLPPRTLHALDPESDNLAFAWKWSCEHELTWAFKGSAAFSRYEIARGRPAALLAQFAHIEKQWTGEPDLVKGEFDLATTFLFHACSREQEAIELLHSVHALAKKLNDQQLLTRASLGLALHAFRHDFPQANQRAKDTIALAEAIGDGYVVALGHKIMSNVANFTHQRQATIHHAYLSYQGLLAADAGTEVATSGGYLAAHLWFQDRADEAAPILERAWAILEETREPGARAYMTELEGRFAIEVGRFEEAEAYFRESLRLWTTIGSVFQQADQNHSITRALIGQGRHEDAKKTVVDAADLWYEDRNQGGTCCSLVLAAWIFREMGQIDEAKKLLAFAVAYEPAHQMVLVKGELNFRAQLISEIGDIGSNKLETTLDVAHSLFEPLR